MTNVRRAGLTLIEVLIALALSVVLLAAVYGAVDMAWRYDQRGRELAGESQTARALLQLIAQDLRGSTGPITGKRDQIQFQGLEAALEQYLTPTTITYALATDRQRELAPRNLNGVLRGTRLAAAPSLRDQRSSDWEWEHLTDRIRAIQFSYNDGQEWSGEWESTHAGVRPRAIRIQIELNSSRTYSLLVSI